ncbi:MAG: hypothetical protein PHY47_00205 [Lachnospiraceae bacterium]|nr:hypothetical protein [Lachnospiraceae bacterium]
MEDFFNKKRDDKYCRSILCEVYIPGRWFDLDSGMTILEMLSCDVKKKVPLYNPKLIIDILLINSFWNEGWEIIKTDFIKWVKENEEIPKYLRDLDLEVTRDRKRFVLLMNRMMFFSCSTMRLKIIEIIKSRESK